MRRTFLIHTKRHGLVQVASRRSFSYILTSNVLSPNECWDRNAGACDALKLFHNNLSTGMIRHLQHNRGHLVNVDKGHCFVNIDSLGTLLRHHCQNHRPQPAYSSSIEFIEDTFCSCLDMGILLPRLYTLIAKRFVSDLMRAGASSQSWR